MYTPQTDDLHHVLFDVNGFSQLLTAGIFPDLSEDLIEAVLSEAGRFAAEVLAPLNRTGDTDGCHLNTDTHDVTTAPGWKEAYRQWAESGWASLPCTAEFGGQGLPISIGLAVQELWNTAVSAYGIGTLLTQGAIEAIHHHGSDELKQKYLPDMIAGTWTGTMNLTESHSGSDLSTIRTKAEPAGDGTYKITGTKIFITYGEHDLTENIIHLVLARLPDAPEGTRGISLFLVPKYLVNDDGSRGARNDVKCIGLEHKLGIHGSPTATLRFGDDGGATGWLVGQENRGLNCMFTMMNNARLHVGMQGVAVAERAFQQALAYAQERRQGRKPGHDGSVPIIEHPDVRRMLLDMKTQTAAARCICFETARALDLATHGRDKAERAENTALSALLTPVAKAYGTQIGCDVASIGVQVHGGMGFIEETGAAQHYRDARITPIYEGTNGIQAIDLVTRKLPLGNGDVVRGVIAENETLAEELAGSGHGDLEAAGKSLARACTSLSSATGTMLNRLENEQEAALASATPYLRLLALTVGAAGLARGARNALRSNSDGKAEARVHLARYFCDNHLAEASSLESTVKAGADTILRATPDLLAM